MQITPHSYNCIDDVYELGKDYVIILSVMHSSDDQLSDPLVLRLDSYDFGKIPKCVISLRLDGNDWIGKEIMVPQKCPGIYCIAGGVGMCNISNMDEFEESMAQTLNMGKQTLPSWIKWRERDRLHSCGPKK